jgi:hypothetical protein
MTTKLFTTYQPTEDNFIELPDRSGTVHSFKLNPSLPGKVILDFMFVSGTDDSGKLAQSIQNVIDIAIVEADKDRWDKFTEDPMNGVTVSVLAEVVGHITSVLSGNPQDRE